MSKKILFFDIDGTLWDYKTNIPQSLPATIKAVQKAGNLCFINSGRTRAFIRDRRLLDLGFDGIVSGCGTRIECRGQVVFNYELDRDFALRAVETAKKYNFKMLLEGPEYLYMNKAEFEGNRFGNTVIEQMGADLKDLDSCDPDWHFSKFSCLTLSEKREEGLAAFAKDFDELVHDPLVAEFVPKPYTKATGLLQTCSLLGLDAKDSFAFGDGINDVSMLKAAGTGIAMASGRPPAIEVADYVTSGVMEDGILNACRHFSLL